MTLTITRRAAVLAAATLTAVGGAVIIGLAGSHSAPDAGAATYPIGDSTAIASDAFPGITVQGAGLVTGTPDTLILQLSVSKQAGDVSTVLGQVNSTMTAVQGAFTTAKVAAADQKTSGLNVGPQYDYSGGKPRITGYTATESLTVTLRDTKTAGATIGAAVAAGGDAVQVNGLSTDLKGNSGLMSQARDAAMADAKAKATQYAKAAGRSLGAVVRVEEAVASNPGTPLPLAAGAMSAKDSAVPIQMGSTDVSVQVTVVYAFS